MAWACRTRRSQTDRSGRGRRVRRHAAGRAVEIAAVVTSLVVRADVAWVIRGGSASAEIAKITCGRSVPCGLGWTSQDTRITLAVALTACLAILL